MTSPCTWCGCIPCEPHCLGTATVSSPHEPDPTDAKIAEAKRAAREEGYEQRFREFHQQNPDVYDELVTLCRKALAAGQRKVGIRMLWEVLRWNRLVETKHAENEFKLNDHFHSRYARLVMRQEPDLRNVFELRELRSH